MQWVWTNVDAEGAHIFEAEDREAALRVVIGMRLRAAGYDVQSPDVNDLHDVIRSYEAYDSLQEVVPMDPIEQPYLGPWHGLEPSEL